MRAARQAVVCVLGFLVAGLASCGGDKLVLPKDAVPTTITIVKGNGQTGTVGVPLTDSLIVRVTDASSHPVESQPVTFTVTSGGGSVTAATGTTNADGRAGTRWVLGSGAGQQSVQAKVTGPGAPANLVATFTANGSASGATTIAAVSGNNQTGTAGSALTDSLVVVVTDASGNPVAGVSVDWTVTGGGAVSAPSVPTGADGRSAVKRTLGAAAGAQTTVATAAGLTGSPITFAATATVGSAGQLTITRQPSATAQSAVPFGQQPQIQLRDVNGNVVHQPGVAVTAEIVKGTGVLIGSSTAATDAAGLATFSGLGITGPAGTYQLNFKGTNLSGVTSVDISIAAGNATTLGLSVPPSTTASSGVPLSTQPTIQLLDAAGNPVAQAGVTVFAQIQSGTVALSGATSVQTDATGAATFTDLTLTGASGSQATIAFGAGPLAGIVSGTITLGAGNVSASKSTLSVSGSPITASSGSSAATVTVTARDASNNVIPGAAVSVSVTGLNTITQPAGGVANGSGVATATAYSAEAGVKTVTAMINGVTITQQGTLTVNPGPPSASHSTVSAAPGSIAAATGTSTITVTVLDAFDNAISGATVALSATGSGNSITQPLGATNASGVAVGSFSSTTAEGKTISATATKAPSAAVPITQTASVAVGIGNADAAKSSLTVSPASITVGVSSATVTVVARDAGNNPISGAAASVSVTGSGNTLTPASGTTNASGTFTTTLTSVEAGSKTVTASVNGTTLTTQPTITVNKATPTTTITSQSSATSVVGQSVTIDYSVAPPGLGTVTGTVTVTGGGTSCQASVAAGSCSLAPTTAGAASFVAAYGGDANFNAASSAGTAHTVNPASTTTAITSDNPDPSNVGQAVTVAYTVTAVAPGGGTPSGTVNVSDGVNSCSGTVASGSCSATFNTTGARTITATYVSNGNYAASSGNTSHTVQSNGATVNLGASPTSSVTGQTVTFTATVSGGSGTPTGTVQFKVDGANVGSAVALVGGSAQISTALDAGSHVIAADYSGNGTYGQSSGSIPAYSVGKGSTVTTIISDAPDPSGAGTGYTVSFSVAPSGGSSGTPGGTVTISDGTDSCNDSAPTGSCVLTSTTFGSKTLTATYSGDADFLTSSKTAPHTVNAAASSVSVTSSANPSSDGQDVTFTATVSGGVGTPTGTVQFMVDGSPSGAPVSLSGGVATTTVNFTGVTTHTVSATYSGNTTYSGSSGTLSGGQQVALGSTSTSIFLAAGPNPSTSGAPLSFTATVSPVPPAAGVATGTMTFKDGSTAFGSGALSGGTLTVMTSSLTAAGTHLITAVYGGSSHFSPSNSSALSHTITAGGADAGQSGVSATTPIAAGGSASTVTVTVRDAAGNPLSGQSVALAVSGSGNSIAQPPATNGSGVTSGSFTSTVAGAKTVSATAGGSVLITQQPSVTVNPGGVSIAQSSLAVGPPTTITAGGTGTSITVTAKDAFGNVIPGQSVVISVTGSGNTVTPSGAITTDGAGQATATVSSTQTGSKTVTAAINANTINASGTLLVGGGAPSATTSTVAAGTPITAGGAGSTVTVTVNDGAGNPLPGQTVTLAVSGSGNSITQPSTTDGSGVAAGSFTSTAAGSKTVTATVNGSVVISQQPNVTVNAGAADAGQSTVAASSPVTAGSPSTVTVSVKDQFGNPVGGSTVTLGSAPADGSPFTAADPTDGAGVTTSAFTPASIGDYVITATADGVTIAQTATVTAN